jgi:hypothetical protein
VGLALFLLLTALPASLYANPKAQFSATSSVQVFDYPRADLGTAPVRRFAQDLRLYAFDLLDDDALPLSLSMWTRTDVDFALLSMSAPYPLAEQAQRYSLRRVVLQARQWWGKLDFTVGRQVLIDELGFFEFDGVQLGLSLWRGLAVELLCGTELPALGIDQHTHAISMDAGHYLDQPLFVLGTALRWDARDWQVRTAYRHFLRDNASTTESRSLSLLAFARLAQPLSVSTELVLDAFLWHAQLLRLDLRLALLDTLSLAIDAERRVPHFRSSSIFGLFDLRPIDELGLSLRYQPHPRLELGSSLAVLLYETSRPEDELEPDTLLSASASWRFLDRFRLGVWYRGRVSADAASHSTALRFDAFDLIDRVQLSVDAYYAHLNKEWRPQASGHSFGAALRARLELGPSVRIDSQLETLSHPLSAAELRWLGVLELGFWL